jgi:hypothetical protein
MDSLSVIALQTPVRKVSYKVYRKVARVASVFNWKEDLKSC